MHFIDLVKRDIDDFAREQERLQLLFERKQFYTTYNGTQTLKHLIANTFRTSRFRGTFTDLDDFLNSNKLLWNNSSLEGLLLYCEMLVNLLHESQEQLEKVADAWGVIDQILKNIQIIVGKTNHVIKHTNEGIVIVRKDALTAVAIEDVADRDVATAILEYNHNGIQGNLERKKQLLAIIGKHVEPLTQKSGLKNEQRGLVDDVTFCLNNLDIRHNNKDGEKAKPFLQDIPQKDLEALYDGAYRSMLLLIEMEAHKEFHSKTKSYRNS